MNKKMIIIKITCCLLCRDQLLVMSDRSKHDVIDAIQCLPAALEAEDIEDFCSLAQYYASKTPQSFRTVRLQVKPE